MPELGPPELGPIGWSWTAAAAAQALLLCAAAEILHRLFPRRLAPEVRLALWGAALVRLVLPPTLGAPAYAGALLDSPAAGELGRRSALAAGLALAWLGGALLLGSLAIVRHVRARRLLERAARARIIPAELAREIEAAARTLGLGRAPRAVLLAERRGPAVVGLLRPVLALPADFGAWTREERRHALLHELAHVRCGDPWLAALALAIRCLWWPHPAAWLACRRFSAALELAADERAARALGPEAEGYRRTLLRAAERGLATAGPEFALHHAVPGTLILRLERLEQPVWMRSAGARARSWLGGAALALSLAPAAMLEQEPITAGLVREAHALLTAAARGEPQSCFQKHFAAGVLARAGASLPPDHEGTPR